MSKSFPTDKDHILDKLDDDVGISEEEYDSLRLLTKSQLLLLSVIVGRAIRQTSDPESRI